MRETGTTEPARAEMLETGGSTEYFVTATIKRSDTISQIYDGGAVIIVRRASIEQIVIHIRRHHEQLINQSHQQWLILARPCSGHRFLHNVVSHAVGDQ